MISIFKVRLNDSRIRGDIPLNIKRAAVSTKKCAYPFCPEQEDTRLIPIGIRSKAIRELRFYIPPRCVVCQNHRQFEQWQEGDIRDFELIPYTLANIEDMIDLLRFKPKCLKYEMSGEEIGLLSLKTTC